MTMLLSLLLLLVGAAIPAGAQQGSAATSPADSVDGYELSAVDAPPVLGNRLTISRFVERTYPGRLREQGISGTVVVRLLVAADGTTSRAAVVSSTHPGFHAAALEAVTRMRFRPAKLRGRSVPAWVSLPLSFRVATSPSSQGGEPR